MALTNQLKTVLPWVCALGLGAGMVVLRARNRDAQSELSGLRQAGQELNRLRSENEELKKVQVQAEELARLRKENEEIHRLRNEVHQLREEKQQAAKPGQPAPAPAAPPKTDAPWQQQMQLQLQQLRAENERLRAENLQLQQVRAEAQANAPAATCINNLRMIEGAKEQWALENRKAVGTAVTAQDLQPYLRNNTPLACPLGGVYTLNPVGTLATCNIAGHAISQ